MVERKKKKLNLDLPSAEGDSGNSPPPSGDPASSFRPSNSAGKNESGVQEILRGARRAKGLKLPDVAARLKIRLAHLEAIEGGHFSDLPGATYAAGFIRSYAKFLGLDHEMMVSRFRAEVAGFSGKTELNFPEPVPESRVPSGAIILISVLLAVLAYGMWYRLSSDSPDSTEIAQQAESESSSAAESQDIPSQAPEAVTAAGANEPLPQADMTSDVTSGVTTASPENGTESPGAELPGGPATQAASPSAQTASPSQPAQPVVDQSASKSKIPEAAAENTAPASTGPAVAPVAPADASAEDEVPLIETVTPSSSDDQAALLSDSRNPWQEENRAPQVYGAEEGQKVRIVIESTDDSWVQVQDASGKTLLSRILRPGDRYRVPDQSGLALLTGNAGALDFFVDGEKTPAIGIPGSVRRDVALDPALLKAGQATDPR